jgi:hypothetical protein
MVLMRSRCTKRTANRPFEEIGRAKINLTLIPQYLYMQGEWRISARTRGRHCPITFSGKEEEIMQAGAAEVTLGLPTPYELHMPKDSTVSLLAHPTSVD